MSSDWSVVEGDRLVSRSKSTGKRLGKLKSLSQVGLEFADDSKLSYEMAVNAALSVLIQARRLGLGLVTANKIARTIDLPSKVAQIWLWALIRDELGDFEQDSTGRYALYGINDEQWKEWRYRVYWRGLFTKVADLHRMYCPNSNLSTLHRRIHVLGWPADLALAMPKEHSHGRKKAKMAVGS